MSRIGNDPVNIPEGVTIQFDNNIINIKGKLGELSQEINPNISVDIADNTISFSRNNNLKENRSLHGLYRALIYNMVQGVTQGFTKKLEMNGVGYRAALKGKTLELLLGYSHPINYDIPENITVTVDKQNNIEIKGPDKQLVGQTAAEIRNFRGPEPYKGKGIKYADEYINRKEGKKK